MLLYSISRCSIIVNGYLLLYFYVEKMINKQFAYKVTFEIYRNPAVLKKYLTWVFNNPTDTNKMTLAAVRFFALESGLTSACSLIIAIYLCYLEENSKNDVVVLKTHNVIMAAWDYVHQSEAMVERFLKNKEITDKDMLNYDEKAEE